MFVKNLHVISFLGIFSLLSITFPCIAENALAGKVVYISDKLFAVAPDYSERSIKRGASFFQGDTLKTSESSRVQLRFRDGAVVVLHSETEFRIDAFSYADTIDAQLQNEASIFRGSLLKGSLRTITGDIGKKDPGSYWLNTPVATVFQVQDANYELVLGNAGLAVAVWEGSLVIENEGGSITLGGDSEFSYAFITETTVIPQGLSTPPDLVEWNKEDQVTEEP
ncbi:MAG: FecR domain-containing protein [Gammaproteobacteria bacterium]|nr:FecR domain-containing protein [Gammaproteobacteria bacterium]MCK5091134.1 FecR domain-containing protein [Gammaproteobacteria bacterium]